MQGKTADKLFRQSPVGKFIVTESWLIVGWLEVKPGWPVPITYPHQG